MLSCTCGCASKPGRPDRDCLRFVTDFGAGYREQQEELREIEGRAA